MPEPPPVTIAVFPLKNSMSPPPPRLYIRRAGGEGVKVAGSEKARGRGPGPCRFFSPREPGQPPATGGKSETSSPSDSLVRLPFNSWILRPLTVMTLAAR